jgi:hypothetical protein
MTDTEDSATGVYDYVVSLAEKTLIQHVLSVCQGIQTKAAARLGINRNTLHKKLSEFRMGDGGAGSSTGDVPDNGDAFGPDDRGDASPDSNPSRPGAGLPAPASPIDED